MLKIYDIREKQEYLEEVVTLTRLEWGNKNDSKEEFKSKVREKIEINPKEPKYLKVIWGVGYKVENLNSTTELVSK